MIIITMYDCCTYFQSINKIVQSFFAVTFETFYRTFLFPQNRVYTQKQFYLRIYNFCLYIGTKTSISLILKPFRPESEMQQILIHEV